MSANNGVIRIGKKGMKKFAFGEQGEPFEVDVVVAFQEWVGIDESFRQSDGEPDVVGTVLTTDMAQYHCAAVDFVKKLAGADTEGKEPDICTAEALDFIARLREVYEELAVFFRPKSREERGSQDTSGAELRFSAEPAQN